jgi:hypothetical protein
VCLRRKSSQTGTVYAIPGGAPPYRSLLLALLDYSEQVQARGDNHSVLRHRWQHVLQNQTALLIEDALLFGQNIALADAPYLLGRQKEARVRYAFYMRDRVRRRGLERAFEDRRGGVKYRLGARGSDSPPQ